MKKHGSEVLRDLIDELKAEAVTLRRLIVALADRVAAQSELLAKRAEK